MKYFLSLMAVASLVFAGAVQAHAKLEKSLPAANSTLSASPKTVELVFNEKVEITSLTLQAGDAKANAIGSLPKRAASNISVPLPPLASGSYTLSWRALGDDGHVMSGKIPFKIGADEHHSGMKH